jgi:hypothetical protein
MFVSDAPDATLNAFVAPQTSGGHGPSQRKWFYGVMEAARRIRNGLPSDFVVVADDDTFLVVPNLLRFLADKDSKQRAYWGQRCSPTNCHGGPCVCGGGGWAATAPLFLELADAFSAHGSWPLPCCSDYNSDVSISMWMNQVAKTPLVDSAEFCSQPPGFYLADPLGVKDKPEGFGRAVTFHYVDAPGFKLLFYLTNAFASQELLEHLVLAAARPERIGT